MNATIVLDKVIVINNSETCQKVTTVAILEYSLC